MKYNIVEISDIIDGKLFLQSHNIELNNVVFDSRKISFAQSSIFIAFTTQNNDGHRYINIAYKKGIRNFIVSEKIELEKYKNANFILVNDTLKALQKFATHHRSLFNIPVIGITGSNGKTILKEWLNKALSLKYKVVQSPNSYNSQIGVALSLLKINSTHEIAIIEAGISEVNEMQNLEKMIRPTLGIFTNIGDAHSIGFNNIEAKVKEKSILFSRCKNTIFSEDNTLITNSLNDYNSKFYFNWSRNKSTPIQIISQNNKNKITRLKIKYKDKILILNIPFTNQQFIDLSVHLICCLLRFKFDEKSINRALNSIDVLPSRLEIKEGENNCILINDSYSSDMSSMQLALEYQEQHSKNTPRVVIFSDIDQQSSKDKIYSELQQLFYEKKIEQLFAVGIDDKYKSLFQKTSIKFFKTTENLIDFLLKESFKEKCILIKGARKFRLENIFDSLSFSVHQTTLETNFSALENNLNVYKSYLNNETKIMAVIKADAYGSGSIAVAEYLQRKGIDYIAVALIDEAIKIRKSGCTSSIMVFNIHNDSFRKLWEYNLEPEVYSLHLLRSLSSFAKTQNTKLNIHLKVDTGMHRLGLEKDEINELVNILNSSSNLHIVSIFSHFSASENSEFDDFSNAQIKEFLTIYNKITESIDYSPMKHILNTGGVIRFPTHQFEMVRLGLGLYGVDETLEVEKKLEKVHSLKAKILQIKHLKEGETTGYGRSGVAVRNTTIATVSLGYADGLMRSCGNGKFSVYLNGHFCPTIGHICMDVMMIDITHVPQVHVYDEVEIFGKNVHLEELARSCGTISYEIISRMAPRVKRIYTYN